MSKYVISATMLSRELSKILNKVLYQGRYFEIRRGNEIIAKLIPVEDKLYHPKMTVSELQKFIAHLPSLDKEDCQDFLNDIKSIRSQMTSEENPWD